MSVPETRLLGNVLRQAVRTDTDKLQMIFASGGVPLAGAEALAYVNVVVEGQTVKVPRLSGSVVPTLGGPAYVLVTRNFMLYIGTVKTT